MVGAGRAGLPELVQLAGQTARGMQQGHASLPIARCTAPITCASDGSAALVGPVTLAASPCQSVLPLLALLGPGGRRLPALQRGSKFDKPLRARRRPAAAPGACRHRKAGMFRPMMVLSVFLNSAQEPVVKSWSRVPTASTTSASSRQPVGGGGAGDADRRHVERMPVRQRRFAALGLADRNAGRLDELRRVLRRPANRGRRRRRSPAAFSRLERRRPRPPARRRSGRGRRGVQTRSARRSFPDSHRPRPARPGTAPASPARIRQDRSAPAWRGRAPG